ncbi:MAG: nucleotidyl transferase AbiEii/AbiGii toxin family protein [Lentisphaeria bacterium]|nr:nucleotidyl transferase AbiEii/AbiGii toxin family protein [Lentisphaeria bacterium]
MEKIINASPAERQRVFQTAAATLRIAPEMVEKDFWVCRILQKLFQDEKLRKILRFKGGTSLSKVFHLIQRFSEDVDLILDWRCVTGENPLLQRSNTRQDIFNKSIQNSSGKYISGKLRTMVEAAMDGECSVVSDVNDDHVLLLQYPLSFRSSYIVPHIRLEIGPLAAWLPNREFPILPYAAEVFPQLNIAPVSVPTILAERTFWEKVTILHQEHHRPEHLKVPLRYSRHYYDLYMMAQSECAVNAMKDASLLRQVVDFKRKFYPRACARSDLAVPGTMELLPAQHSQQSLQTDYAAMKNMIFGNYPSWVMILQRLAELQRSINNRS